MSDTEIVYDVEYPRDSGQLTVEPTINGLHPLLQPAEEVYLTAYYQAPKVEYAKFTPTGK